LLFSKGSVCTDLHLSTVDVSSSSKSAKSCGSNEHSLRIYWERVARIATEAGGSEGIFCGLFGDGAARDTFWLDSSLHHVMIF
jgi:hypothetical protein